MLKKVEMKVVAVKAIARPKTMPITDMVGESKPDNSWPGQEFN